MAVKGTTAKAKIITPGQTTPSYPNGGWFTVKAAPVTINGTKDQIIDTLLRFNAYHTWNSFCPVVSDITHPSSSNANPANPSTPTPTTTTTEDPNIATVGSRFVFHARMIATLPWWKYKSAEKVTVIDRQAGIVAWMAETTPGERVHVITEDGYGTCKYECYETFQSGVKVWFTRLLFGYALKLRFDEWSQDLKKAVEGRNW